MLNFSHVNSLLKLNQLFTTYFSKWWHLMLDFLLFIIYSTLGIL
jgi:hypothetical protein